MATMGTPRPSARPRARMRRVASSPSITGILHVHENHVVKAFRRGRENFHGLADVLGLVHNAADLSQKRHGYLAIQGVVIHQQKTPAAEVICRHDGRKIPFLLMVRFGHAFFQDMQKIGLHQRLADKTVHPRAQGRLFILRPVIGRNQ